MNITLMYVGKTSEKYVSEGMKIYMERLPHYCRFNLVEIDSGQGDKMKIVRKESENIFKKMGEKDVLILLDEKGKEFTSVQFSEFLNHNQNTSTKNLFFLIGGAYGFSEEVYQRANARIALSKLTFAHQLVRVIFLEQLYRAFTILKGEKYHH